MKWVLVIVVVAVGAWMLLTRTRTRTPTRGAAPPASPSSAAPTPPSPSAVTSQAMVACAHCAVHLPQDEAFWAGSQPYCCEAHRKAHAPTAGQP